MKPMDMKQWHRYQELLQEWREAGVRVGWKEYRRAYAQALEETGPMLGQHKAEGGKGKADNGSK